MAGNTGVVVLLEHVGHGSIRLRMPNGDRNFFVAASFTLGDLTGGFVHGFCECFHELNLNQKPPFEEGAFVSL